MSACLVFTDLDGTLLDHHDYSHAAALPALRRLAELGVPVVPVTSKTRAELESLRAILGNDHPFVVENGAAVFIPVGYFDSQPDNTVERDGYWVYETVPPRQRWLELLEALATRFPDEFESFSVMGRAGIARVTGLSADAAALANQREYSEPVRWLGSEEHKAQFVSLLRDAGANPLQGGRFLTVAGDCDKGRALHWLRATYARAWQVDAIFDVAAGDSGNDVAMLEAAQTALVIRSPAHDFPRLERADGVMYSEACGPLGWNEGIGRWLASTAIATELEGTM